MRTKVLVVDDEESVRKLLVSRLERDGHDVLAAADGKEAQSQIKEGDIGVLVTDLKMPGMDGFALIGWAKDFAPSTRIIVITGHGEKEAAVNALRKGASDYLEKPFDLDQLSFSVRRCLKEYRLERENVELLERLEARVARVEGKSEDRYWYVSQAPAMAKVNEWLAVLRRESMRGGSADEPSVLILGESGTGKEGIARMVHAGSRRGKGPWVAVNCANFSEQLLESELFGHERGAFTGAHAAKPGLFELAKGGTLFLDELGEMDLKLQAKLLRVLQERLFRRVGGTLDITSDVRVVAATNSDLKEKVRQGKFREDLYHRLCAVEIEVPPLRERAEDILEMAAQFAERSFRARGKRFVGFESEAEVALRLYTWPGNVRELLNAIERAALLASEGGRVPLRALSIPGGVSFAPRGPDGTPGRAHLTLVQGEGGEPGAAEVPTSGYMELKKKWSDSFEKEYLMAALIRHHGNVSSAAREAHLDRSNFLRLLRRHHIQAAEFRKPGVGGEPEADEVAKAA